MAGLGYFFLADAGRLLLGPVGIAFAAFLLGYRQLAWRCLGISWQLSRGGVGSGWRRICPGEGIGPAWGIWGGGGWD